MSPAKMLFSQGAPDPSPSSVPPVTHYCTCCGQRSTFRYIGTQHFPKQVTTLRPGSSASLTLWTCGTCSTTLSNLERL
jgi:hypothetical protein